MSDIKTLDSIVNEITRLKGDLKALLMRANRRCPECEGTNLNTANTECFDCSASDYS